ncbi:hypothetical protein N7535_007065 [Penicillium sp. DV-2018c]|nr:hypothetical protein N7461_006840 [Penicillium sp. DV-2018c]KAJ5567759.1 hypothetical protein N7535_007065 [Penicillium sp. DV-2018c]
MTDDVMSGAMLDHNKEELLACPQAVQFRQLAAPLNDSGYYGANYIFLVALNLRLAALVLRLTMQDTP